MLRLLRPLLLLLLLPPPGSPEPPGLAQLSPGAPPQAPDLLYADGLRAYAAGAWAPAVALLREALRSQAALGRARLDCGASCAAEPGAALPAVLLGAPEPDSGPEPTQGSWEQQLLRAALRRADCLTQCAARRLGPGGAARLRVVRALRDAFRRREPYNYLQRAYYQVGSAPGGSEVGGMLLSGPRAGLGAYRGPLPYSRLSDGEDLLRSQRSSRGECEQSREAGREQIEDGGTGPALPRNEAEAVGVKPAVGREVCVGRGPPRPDLCWRAGDAAATGTAAAAYVAGEAGRRLHSPQPRVLETCGFA
ncbi:hypothetical protein P7K49_019203 [Saguinus oedipus]|uniref:Leprecan-like alpha-helical domain-containing protein n=1 Tax=Saguinus oedipus TaxID=9490 RepID=A0ABQ9UWS2_SAGOE|nr:hypothetical protein P7K49_019203 [Saguinus oedipus]